LRIVKNLNALLFGSIIPQLNFMVQAITSTTRLYHYTKPTLLDLSRGAIDLRFSQPPLAEKNIPYFKKKKARGNAPPPWKRTNIRPVLSALKISYTTKTHWRIK